MSPIIVAQDRDLIRAVKLFSAARRAEANYLRRLMQVARNVGHLVSGLLDPRAPHSSAEEITTALRRYAGALDDWARAAGRTMVREVDARDWATWQRLSKDMGVQFRQDMRTDPIMRVAEDLILQQADLITSLPLDAAQRVQLMAIQAYNTGERPDVLAEKIRRTYGITANRAQLIAFTETGRAATTIQSARAQHIGSTHFVWRTVLDNRVRPSHRILEGKAFRWDDPPLCDPPDHHALPGCIWRCRCVAEPIIPGI